MTKMASLFSAHNVTTMDVKGLEAYQARLARMAADLDPKKTGMREQMARAAGMLHRHLMGLSKVTGTPGRGVLPVDKGRLKNSLFWDVRGQGQSVVGRVATNLGYAGPQEDKRGYMEKTQQDMEKPIYDLFGAYVRKVANQ